MAFAMSSSRSVMTEYRIWKRLDGTLIIRRALLPRFLEHEKKYFDDVALINVNSTSSLHRSPVAPSDMVARQRPPQQHVNSTHRQESQKHFAIK